MNPIDGYRKDLAARTRNLAADLRVDIASERRWNAKHPAEAPLCNFADLDPDLDDAALLAQFVHQELNRKP